MKKNGWLNENIMPLLALIVVVGGGYILSQKPDLKTEIVALVMLVLGFYFGSSPGSRKKDDALVALTKGGQATQPQNPTVPVAPAPVPPETPKPDPTVYTQDLVRHDLPGDGPVG